MPSTQPVVDIKLDDSDIKKLARVLPAKAERGVKYVAKLIEDSASVKAPYSKRADGGKGGNLKSSGTTAFSGHGFDTAAEIKFTAPYAIYVHEGTGIYGPKQAPYTIVPVNKKALFWPGAAHPVKKVTIRGMKARPFLKEAFEEEVPKLRDLLFG